MAPTPTNNPAAPRASRRQSSNSSTRQSSSRPCGIHTTPTTNSRHRPRRRRKPPAQHVNTAVVNEIGRALRHGAMLDNERPRPFYAPIYVPPSTVPRKRRHPMDVDCNRAHDSGPARKRRGFVGGEESRPPSPAERTQNTSLVRGLVGLSSASRHHLKPHTDESVNRKRATKRAGPSSWLIPDKEIIPRNENVQIWEENDHVRKNEVTLRQLSTAHNTKSSPSGNIFSHKDNRLPEPQAVAAFAFYRIVCVISSACLLFVCLARLAISLVFPSTAVFHAVDWVEKAIALEVTLASIPRIVLFGEVSQANISQPGMLPLDGLSHDRDPLFDPNDSLPLQPKWFSNSTDFPRYVPWVTTSTGVFVPESDFLHDLDVVFTELCLGLRVLEASNLPSFTHDETFCGALRDARLDFELFHMWEISRLASYYTTASLLDNKVTLLNLVHLLELYQNGTESFGSDDARVRALYRTPTSSIDLARVSTLEPLATRKIEMAIPSDIPENFVSGWREVIEDQNSRLAAESATMSSTPANTPEPFTEYEANRPPRAVDYTAAQANNRTVAYLLSNVLKLIIDRPLQLKGMEIIDGSTYGDIITYAELLRALYKRVFELNILVMYAIHNAPTINRDLDKVEPNIQRQLGKRALRQFQDIAIFLDQIAIPRLSEMLLRANRGVVLLDEAQKRQDDLKSAVETTLSKGWVSYAGWWSRSRVYYYLPALKDIMFEWSLARRWILVEAEEVMTIYQGRNAEFQARHQTPLHMTSEQTDAWLRWQTDVVWSRWSLNDSRKDPEGAESFCPRIHDSLETDEDKAPVWERLVEWFIQRHDQPFPQFQCGDASRRHGDGGGLA
ncbi:hypothetical protein NM208_g10501 [Fusarium decemcellulare]|uniref:Uncharacterized protein n=1 Tax=Fusarium decemcellulare TaxID=57161 RepID=A0ACC1RXR5_9HYPO|nr:hypothetical protein NM208_g10501 [Fusarium decemcellulare]